MTITSPAFEKGATLPDRYSRNSDNLSPPLVIRDVPDDAESLALIMDDPDAPSGTFTHWVAFNLDPVDQTLPEGAVLANAQLGSNDWDEPRYGGPRPPSGEHRYFFHVYALDTTLRLPDGADRSTVERAMRDHVIAQASLSARFSAPGG